MSISPLRPAPAPQAVASTGRARPGSAATVGAFVVLAGLVPLVFVRWSENTADPLNVTLASLVVLVSAARLAQSVGSGSPRLLTTMFYLFVYVFLGISTTAQVVVGRYPTDNSTYSQEVVTEGLTVVLLGVAAYEVGLLVSRRRSPDGSGRAPGADAGPALVFSARRLRIVGTVGLLAVAVTLARYGTGPFFDSRDAAQSTLAGTAGTTSKVYALEDKTSYLLLTLVVQVPVFIALLGLLHLHRHRRLPGARGRGEVLDQLLLVALVAANVVVNNPVSNARAWFGTVLIGLVAVYLPVHRLRGKRVLTWSGLGVLLLAFSSLDAFRLSGGARLDTSGPQNSIITNESYSAFQTVLNGTTYLAGADHAHGRQLLGSLLAFVPRSLWTAKPDDTGNLIDPLYNRSATLWTEAQVDFGLLGVLLLFLAYGLLSARIETWCVSRGEAPLACLAVFAGMEIFLLRGSLLPVMGFVYPLVAAVAAVLVRERGADGPAPP